MDNPTLRWPTAAQFNSPERRRRRDIARDVWAAYRAVATAAGFLPIEIRTAEAISLCHYEREGHGYDKPSKIRLCSIGAAMLSASGETDKARVNTASNRASHLFNEAQPRTGYQLLTRYKALEDGRSHEYVDHVMPVAEIVAELHAAERKVILSDSQPQKQARIEESRERLAAEALALLPKCEAQLMDRNGDVYAYLSDAEARAYAAKNPGFTAQAKRARPKRPFNQQDDERLTQKIRNLVADILDEYAERNGLPDANRYSVAAELAIRKEIESWRKVAPARDVEAGSDPNWRSSWGADVLPGALVTDRREEEELIHVPEIVNIPALGPAEDAAETIEMFPKTGNTFPVSAFDYNTVDFSSFDAADSDVAPEAVAGSVNFDTSLEAADSYIRDGWAVVACCQFNPATGRCTGPEAHHRDGVCKGKVPLIKGRKDAKPGDGYTAAMRDRGLARDWFTRQFPAAGVAIRLDGHILIDCDVKDGAPGLESYRILADTFDLPETLSAVTPSGGRHHIFKLPGDLPADFLGSWTRVLDSAELGGIDIKVGARGLAHVEPSRGAKGVYRWLDPTAEIAELPRACCDYLHEIHEREQRAKLQKSAQASARYGSTSLLGTFDPDEDQTKYVKDAPNGQRRPRLRSIANAIAARGATVEQIVDKLKFHDSQFKEAGPTNDHGFMLRVAQGAVQKFAPGVSQ